MRNQICFQNVHQFCADDLSTKAAQKAVNELPISFIQRKNRIGLAIYLDAEAKPAEWTALMAVLPQSVKHTVTATSLTMTFDRPADAKTAKRVVELLAARDYESDTGESVAPVAQPAPKVEQSFIGRVAAKFWCRKREAEAEVVVRKRDRKVMKKYENVVTNKLR